jgi:Beta-lactamase enzyme family
MLLQKLIRPFALLLAFFPSAGYAQNPKAPQADTARTDVFLEALLKQYPQYFDSILSKKQALNVQVIYTQIDRGANGIAGLKHYYFNVNPAVYFDPAASVKLPLALLTMQKLAALGLNGVDRNSTMLTEKAYSGQTAVLNDHTTTNGKPTIAQYLKRMLLVSDAEAANRLYELLGQQQINQQLKEKGYAAAQITERLGADLTEDENRHTNPVKFYAPGNKLIYEQAAGFNTAPFNLLSGDVKTRSRLSLEDLHTMMISLVFPNKVTAAQRFPLSDEDRKYILKYMSQWPAESSNPPYIDEPGIYHPAFSKYLLVGLGKDSISPLIRIFNAAGEADGSFVDIAYIADFDNKTEFFLSAVMDAGQDESEMTGLTFMNHLGKVIYEYELKREKKIVPDLSELKFEYDGR